MSDEYVAAQMSKRPRNRRFRPKIDKMVVKPALDLQPKNRTIKSSPKKNNIQTNDLFGFVDGIVRFAPFIMPRPIPTPAASYVLQRVVSVTAPAGQPLSGCFYVQPDLRFPAVSYFNDGGAGRTVADTFEFGVSRTILLPSESVNVDGVTVHVIPQLISSVSHNIDVRPTIVAVNTPSVNIYPDYRDPDVLRIGVGGKGYYNLTNPTDNTSIITAQFKITGVFNGPPVMSVVWYPNPDLVGNSTSIALASTTISGDEYNFVSSVTPQVHVGSRSFTYTITNVIRLDSFQVLSSSSFVQINSFDVIKGENIYAVPSSESDNWGSTIRLIEGWAPTGLALTATSVSSVAFSGGNIAVGLLPSSITSYTDFQSLYDAIVARRTYKYTGKVIDGAHGLWAPRTLSDVAELSAYTTLNSNLVGIAYNYPASGAAAPEIKFTITMRYDLQVNTSLIPSHCPLSSPTALSRVFALLREHLNLIYGDNPNHMARLRKATQNMVESDTFRKLVSDLGPQIVKQLAATLPGLALALI